MPSGIGAMVLGCVLIYTCMFATGYWIYGETMKGLIFTGIAIVAGLFLIKAWNRMKTDIL